MNVFQIDSPTSVTVNGIMTADILVDSAQSLGGFELELAFNPAVLQAQYASLGELLSRTGRTAEPLGPLVDNATGMVALGGYSYGIQAAVNGGGVLARVTFRAMAGGSRPLNLQNSLLADANGNPTTPTCQNATVKVQPRPVRVYLPLIRK